jgi:hypothetical protein
VAHQKRAKSALNGGSAAWRKLAAWHQSKVSEKISLWRCIMAKISMAQSGAYGVAEMAAGGSYPARKLALLCEISQHYLSGCAVCSSSEMAMAALLWPHRMCNKYLLRPAYGSRIASALARRKLCRLCENLNGGSGLA